MEGLEYSDDAVSLCPTGSASDGIDCIQIGQFTKLGAFTDSPYVHWAYPFGRRQSFLCHPMYLGFHVNAPHHHFQSMNGHDKARITIRDFSQQRDPPNEWIDLDTFASKYLLSVLRP